VSARQEAPEGFYWVGGVLLPDFIGVAPGGTLYHRDTQQVLGDISTAVEACSPTQLQIWDEGLEADG
jgi:hypothetical protein